MNRILPKHPTHLIHKTSRLLDTACLYLSPLALLAIIFCGVIALDYTSQHFSFLKLLATQSAETTGTVGAYQAGQDSSFVVTFDSPENGKEYAILYTRYYSPQTLQGLENGQRVRVRYTLDYESRGILAKAYHEVIRYSGFMQGLEWVLGACLLVLIWRPEILFVGLRGGNGVANPAFIKALEAEGAILEEPTPISGEVAQ
jgi:hypothetical protein